MDSRPSMPVSKGDEKLANIARLEAELEREKRAYIEEAQQALKELRARREDNSTKQSRLEEALEEMHWMQTNSGITNHAKYRETYRNPHQPSAIRNCRFKGFHSPRLHKTRQVKILQRKY